MNGNPASEGEVRSAAERSASWWSDGRLRGFVVFVALLTLGLIVPLIALVRHALKEDLHSHILLIPLVSIYLARLKVAELPRESRRATGWAIGFTLAAAAVFALPLLFGGEAPSLNDRLAQWSACYALLITAGGCFFLGGSWMKALCFPFAFLIFMVPLPDAMVVGFEGFLMKASAWVSEGFFRLSGTPIFRSGQVIELPGMTLEVARECSGIRSTWVLFITSIIASYLFLSSPWHRGLLVAAVIPLGILRNGLRVLVIGLLCVHKGPEMIDSWIHHQGGPVFFGISLVPLFLLAGWFHLREARAGRLKKGSDSSLEKVQNS